MALEDVDVVESPSWWMRRLSRSLVDKRDRFDKLEERQQGKPPLPWVDGPSFSSYESVRRIANTNYEDLIVAALRERMAITGFRTAADSDELGDEKAAKYWKANQLDIGYIDVMDKFLALGEAYVIVDAPDVPSTPEEEEIKPENIPYITAEDPRKVIVEYDQRRPTKAKAAMKLYHDDVTNEDVAYLWLPGKWYKATKNGNVADSSAFRLNPRYWTITDQGTYNDPELVPVVQFRNKDGKGEFEPHVEHIDRINYIILQRLVIATLQAFRQRAAKGLPLKDPATGQQIDYKEIFSMDPGAMWLLPLTAEMWESQQADLTPLLNSVKDDVRDLAAVSRTPLTYLSPDAANSSAEGASLQREGAVYKAEDRMARAGTSWARVMSIAFNLAGDTERGNELDIKTLWRPIERYSLAERTAAAQAAIAAGVPFRFVMADIMQYPPDEIARMDVERMRDQLTQATPQAQPTGPAGNDLTAVPAVDRPAPRPSRAAAPANAGGES